MLAFSKIVGVPDVAGTFASALVEAMRVVPSLAVLLAVSKYKMPEKELEPFNTSVPGDDLVRLLAPLISLEMVSVAPASTATVALAVSVSRRCRR